MKKIIFASFAFALCALIANALPFDSKLTDAEKTKLQTGETIIRSLNNANKMSLSSDNEGAKKILADIRALDPTFLAEVIEVRPYKENENLDDKLIASLLDVKSYIGIPYWSEQHERFFDLYSAAELKSNETKDGIQNVRADLTMSPFGLIDTNMQIIRGKDFVYSIATNENTLRYQDKFRAVKERQMKTAILLFRDGDNWILYGAGGVHTIRTTLFRKRIETSFINRIKTFCNFIFKKI